MSNNKMRSEFEVSQPVAETYIVSLGVSREFIAIDWKDKEGSYVGLLYSSPPDALKAENEQLKMRVAELEAATEHLGLTPQQAKDGLARYKAERAERDKLQKDCAALKENVNYLTITNTTLKDLACSARSRLRDTKEELGNLKLRVAELEEAQSAKVVMLENTSKADDRLISSADSLIQSMRLEAETLKSRVAELEAATEHLGLTPQQAKDGLARYKAERECDDYLIADLRGPL